MRTSPSKPSESKRRHALSFALALCVYAPLAALAFWGWTQDAYKKAGEGQAVTLAFAAANFSAPAAASPAPEPEEKPEEKAPEKPEVKPEVKPEPKPEPKPEVKPEPKPKPKPKPRAEAKHKSKAPRRETQTAQAAPKSPAPAAQSVQRAKAGDAGVATLVYGETEDPFLSAVKRGIDASLKYPRKARRFGWEGQAVVQFEVAADGRLTALELFKSSGRDVLDEAAKKAVVRASASWGSPKRALKLRIPVRFSLTDAA